MSGDCEYRRAQESEAVHNCCTRRTCCAAGREPTHNKPPSLRGMTFLAPIQLTIAQINDTMSLSFRFTNDKAIRFMPTDESAPSLSLQAVRWSFLRTFYFWRNLIVAFLVILPLLIRFWCLSKVAPAAIPFDVDEFCRIEIEPGQNAFDYFREAVRLKAAVEADYRARNIVFQWGDNAVMANGWSVATDPLKQ